MKCALIIWPLDPISDWAYSVTKQTTVACYHALPYIICHTFPRTGHVKCSSDIESSRNTEYRPNGYTNVRTNDTMLDLVKAGSH
jgi:hypothetical protein